MSSAPDTLSVATDLDPFRRAQLVAEGARISRWLIDRRWIYRRIEVVTFTDDLNRTREVTVEFTLPEDFPAAQLRFSPGAVEIDELRASQATPAPPRESAFHYVPLTLVGKQAPTNFDFSDEKGDCIPLLPAQERVALATGVLFAVAGVALGSSRELTEEIKADLTLIADLDPKAAAASLGCLERHNGRDTPHGRLLDSPFFFRLARSLSKNFLAVLPLDASGTVHRRIHFSINERGNRVYRRSTRSVWLRTTEAATRSLGWHPKHVWFTTPGVGHGGTYHLKVRRPEGLKIPEGALVPMSGQRGTGIPEARETVEAVTDRSEPHVYVRGQPFGSTGVAWFNIYPRGRTVVRAAWFTAVGVALILVLGSSSVDRLAGNGSSVEAAATLLLIVPTLAAAFVARSSEHLMATTIVFGVRFLTAMSGAASFGAACTLVLAEGYGTDVQLAWDACAAVAIVVLVALTMTLLRTVAEGRGVRAWISGKLRP